MLRDQSLLEPVQTIPVKPPRAPTRSKRQTDSEEPDFEELHRDAQSKVSNVVVLVDANNGDIIHIQVNL